MFKEHQENQSNWSPIVIGKLLGGKVLEDTMAGSCRALKV